MQQYERDANDVIARYQAELNQAEQLHTAMERVMSLYAYEHLPLSVPFEQRKEIASLWNGEYATNHLDSQMSENVQQLGKALGHAYELQADSAYTIADRLQMKKAGNRRRDRLDQKGNLAENEALAKQLVDDIILARISLSGNLRNPEKAAAIAKETRERFGNMSFGETVITGLQLAPIYFPKPIRLDKRKPLH